MACSSSLLAVTRFTNSAKECEGTPALYHHFFRKEMGGHTWRFMPGQLAGRQLKAAKVWLLRFRHNAGSSRRASARPLKVTLLHPSFRPKRVALKQCQAAVRRGTHELHPSQQHLELANSDGPDITRRFGQAMQGSPGQRGACPRTSNCTTKRSPRRPEPRSAATSEDTSNHVGGPSCTRLGLAGCAWGCFARNAQLGLHTLRWSWRRQLQQGPGQGIAPRHGGPLWGHGEGGQQRTLQQDQACSAVAPGQEWGRQARPP